MLFIPTHSSWETDNLPERVTTYFPWIRGPPAKTSVYICPQAHWTPPDAALKNIKNNWEKDSSGRCLKGGEKELGKCCLWEHHLWTWQVDDSGWTLTRREQCYWGKGLRTNREGLRVEGSLIQAVWAMSVAAGPLPELICLSSAYWGGAHDWCSGLSGTHPCHFACFCQYMWTKSAAGIILLYCSSSHYVAAWMQPFISASLPGNPLARVTAPAFLLPTCCSSL